MTKLRRLPIRRAKPVNPPVVRAAIHKLRPTCWSKRIQVVGSPAVAKPLFPSEVWEKACALQSVGIAHFREAFFSALCAPRENGNPVAAGRIESRSRNSGPKTLQKDG
jgi:hypothetical protein